MPCQYNSARARHTHQNQVVADAVNSARASAVSAGFQIPCSKSLARRLLDLRQRTARLSTVHRYRRPNDKETGFSSGLLRAVQTT